MAQNNELNTHQVRIATGAMAAATSQSHAGPWLKRGGRLKALSLTLVAAQAADPVNYVSASLQSADGLTTYATVSTQTGAQGAAAAFIPLTSLPIVSPPVDLDIDLPANTPLKVVVATFGTATIATGAAVQIDLHDR